MEDNNYNQDFKDDNQKADYSGTNKNEGYDSIFNLRVKAGSKRTYFFDVKTNRKEDFFIIITERRKKFKEDTGFDKNRIYLYKEDFNKFLKGLTDSITHVKTELMPDFDFDTFDRKYDDNGNYQPDNKPTEQEDKETKKFSADDKL